MNLLSSGWLKPTETLKKLMPGQFAKYKAAAIKIQLHRPGEKDEDGLPPGN